MPRLLIVPALLLASCGERVLLRDDGGRYRVVAEVTDVGALQAAVAKAKAPAAVVVLAGDVPATVARASGQRLLAIADTATTLSEGVDALVAPATGAAIAVDCAVVASAGRALPPHLRIGARTLTAANAAAGGAWRPAPGDLAAAMLRRDHGDLFAPNGTSGSQRRIAFVQAADGPWHDLVRAEVQAAAARLAGIVIEQRAAPAASWPEIVVACADAGAQAVLVSADDWSGLPTAMARVQARRTPVIALDCSGTAAGATCTVGPDQEVLGMALADALRGVLPDGAAIVLLAAGQRAAGVESRRSGFARALGLRVP